ncbi:hypothetical protein ACHAXS_014281 [Conticribra weissflogii]
MNVAESTFTFSPSSPLSPSSLSSPPSSPSPSSPSLSPFPTLSPSKTVSSLPSSQELEYTQKNLFLTNLPLEVLPYNIKEAPPGTNSSSWSSKLIDPSK